MAQRRLGTLRLWWRLAGAAMLAAAAVPAHAGIATDGTTGPRIELSGNRVDIGADLGRRVGANLFHSFERFGVERGQTVTFTGPDTVRHVVGRVTGGEASRIDGTLRSTIAGADLHLINPAGVVFGPEARLDVPGSFHAGAAPALDFADGSRFAADPAAGNGLTAAPPQAFGFLDRPAGDLRVERGARLEVPAGRAVSLAGGAVAVTGGRVRAERGTIGLTAERDLRLAGGTRLDAGGDGGGTVRIRGGSLVMDDAAVVADNTGARSAGTGKGIDVALGGGLGGGDLRAAGSELSSRARGDGDAGALRVSAGSISLGRESALAASSLGAGAAGPIDVRARRVRLDGYSRIQNDTRGTGPGNRLSVRADEIRLSRRGAISTESFGPARGGTIDLNAGIIGVDDGFIGASAAAEGAAGTVTLRADRLEFRNEGRIFNGTNGGGAGGDVRVFADTLFADATTDHDARFHTGIASSVEEGARGRGGNITVRAREVTLVNGAKITTATAGTGTPGTDAARAGTIDIQAARVTLAGYGLIQNETSGTGPGNRLRVKAGEIRLSERGGISAETFGPARGGTIELDAGRIDVDYGFIGASAASDGAAGTVILNAGRVEFRNEGRIFNGTNGAGAGGDVRVGAGTLLIDATTDHDARFHTGIASSVEAEARGRGGNIRIWSGDATLVDGGKITTASAGLGPAGRIEIDAATLRVDGGLIETAVTEGPGDRPAPATAATTGGDLILRADDVRIAGGGTVAARSLRGPGRAGTIDLTARRTLQGAGGTITTEASQGNGGDVVVKVGRLFDFAGSALRTEATGGSGSGGNIAIDPPLMVLDRSSIIADAVLGRGGNIDIRAGQLVQTPDSVIRATSRLGIDGEIAIAAPNVDIGGTLAALPATFLDASARLRDRCAGRGDQPTSSLIPGGQGGLPPDPSGPLPSPTPDRGAEADTALPAAVWTTCR